MAKVCVGAAAALAVSGALMCGGASQAEAHRYRHYEDGHRTVYYGRAYEGYNGYRPYYGRYYGRPAGIFRPAGVVYRPSYAERSPAYCRRWSWVYSHCGKYAKWRCLDW